MPANSIVQHRAKQINLLFARELHFIEREHSQNIMSHRKLEKAIRRAGEQLTEQSRTKISIPFDQIYNEQTGTLDYQQILHSNINSIQKFRLSFGASSNSSGSSSGSGSSPSRNDDFSDDSSSSRSSRRRRCCSKAQRLPPIIKSHVSNQQKHENKTQHWMTSLPEANKSKDEHSKRFSIIDDEVLEPILPQLTPIQQQVRSFLDTLPAYKGAQGGFDSFAPASRYSIRGPIIIR